VPEGDIRKESRLVRGTDNTDTGDPDNSCPPNLGNYFFSCRHSFMDKLPKLDVQRQQPESTFQKISCYIQIPTVNYFV
jgi:hypothetical protein